MVLDEKLARDNNKKINPPKPRNDDDDEDVVTFMYDIRKPMAFINEGKNGVFDLSKQSGINTAKNVFDKSAIFKT